jgi:hypothetical protein
MSYTWIEGLEEDINNIFTEQHIDPDEFKVTLDEPPVESVTFKAQEYIDLPIHIDDIHIDPDGMRLLVGSKRIHIDEEEI